MKAEIKEYCIVWDYIRSYLPTILKKTVLMSNMMRFRRNWKRLQKMQPETVR